MRNTVTYCTTELFDRILQLKDELDPFVQKEEMQQLLHLIDFIQKDQNMLQINNQSNCFLNYAQKQSTTNGFNNLILHMLLNAAATGNGKAELIENEESFYCREERMKFSFGKDFTQAASIDCDEILDHWFPYTLGRSLCVGPNDLDSEFYSWGSMKELSHLSSSFVLVDNYICSNYNISNLISILETYLKGQKSCEKELHITIVTSKLYSKSRDQEESICLDELKIRIEKSIIEVIGTQAYHLSIVLCKSFENHDRYIFTDYYTFRSGNSFNYFDNRTMEVRLRSVTDLDIIPNTAMNQQELYDTYFEKHRQKVSRIICDAKEGYFIGEKRNRLLKLDY